MRNKILFTTVACCLMTASAQQATAKSWRVNYDTFANADFRTINEAMSSESVADGDTLYLDKGTRINEGQTISKTVTVIGPGYFIGENNADEAYINSNVVIEADGVKLTGLHTNSIYVRAADAVIERCRVTGTIYGNENYDNDDAAIRSCFIVGNFHGRGANGALGWEIVNNLIHLDDYSPFNQFSQAYISHNYIWLYYWNTFHYVNESTITDNILRNGGNTQFYSCSNNVISNNILNYDVPTNNKTATLDYSASDSDTAFVALKTHEEVLNYAASDGEHPGPFYGPYPYVLSGYPLYVPRFENIDIPSKPVNGTLKVKLTIKNQNE